MQAGDSVKVHSKNYIGPGVITHVTKNGEKEAFWVIALRNVPILCNEEELEVVEVSEMHYLMGRNNCPEWAGTVIDEYYFDFISWLLGMYHERNAIIRELTLDDFGEYSLTNDGQRFMEEFIRKQEEMKDG